MNLFQNVVVITVLHYISLFSLTVVTMMTVPVMTTISLAQVACRNCLAIVSYALYIYMHSSADVKEQGSSEEIPQEEGLWMSPLHMYRV